ncbi:LysM peptidoglycan-binding domain-containing protein [Streptomyces sp. SID13031]|uniref:LysM peptidoglycan-binding domain-containing protein n=1 Tax=Streptomyces sp. SID13031 TaxID=2706046 RepID=UPI0013C8AE6A|nr:LysM peptidoglycan-binding domain-containing protein [Streptomyces sp. SID13031]NEA36839.1 LysM peptidoglycan-binding domain-containing protein [Streptomyces sp. SID13031]
MGNTWRKVLRVTTGFAVPLLAAGVITAGSPGFGQYKVKNGDTLSLIAATYGTDVRTLVALNKLPGNGNTIYAGELLRLPGKAATPGAGRSSQLGRASYVVKAGDTIGKIAKRYRCSQASLLAANGLRASDHIYIGKTILVPVKIHAKPVPKKPAKTSKKTKNNTFAGRTYADHIVAAADRNRAVLRNRKLPTRGQLRTMIVTTAKRYGVDPELALAISWQESGWKQRVVSPANAIGAMQVIPSTGNFTSSIVGRKLDLLKPQDNVTSGVVLLSRLTAAAKLDIAVAGYYQGLGGVRRNGMYPDTKRYVQSVLRLKGQFEKGWNPL